MFNEESLRGTSLPSSVIIIECAAPGAAEGCARASRYPVGRMPDVSSPFRRLLASTTVTNAGLHNQQFIVETPTRVAHLCGPAIARRTRSAMFERNPQFAITFKPRCRTERPKLLYNALE